MSNLKTLKYWLLIILFASPVFAEKYAGEFLYLGVGGRPLAMGGAYVAATGDAFSAYYNPAGLIDLDNYQGAFMHSERKSMTMRMRLLCRTSA